jgi:hypothetical protein
MQVNARANEHVGRSAERTRKERDTHSGRVSAGAQTAKQARDLQGAKASLN